MAKTVKQIALEVMTGAWGSGDARKEKLTKAGYDADKVQEKVNELVANKATAVKGMNAWAKMIAKDNTYHYKLWRAGDAKTKTCPVCKNYPVDKVVTDPAKIILGYHGWNCIGFCWAIWHHGGKLPCNCNCHVTADDTVMKIYKAKTNEEALAILKKYCGLENVMVIRGKNGKNIAKTKWQAGDICCQFTGEKFVHQFYYSGNKQIIDSSGSNGKVANDNQIAVRDYTKYSARIIFRYLGDFNALKSIDVIAQEVLDGKWGSGDTRKSKLEKAGYDYNKVQAKVNELIEAKKKEEEAKKVKAKYTGKLPTTTLKKTNAQAKQDAVKWALWIANDNSFHYGYTNKHGSSDRSKWSPNAHHNGCYFCGTNGGKKGILDYKKTYCCNPFVGAAYAHGACDTKAASLCSHKGSWDFGTGVGSYHQSDRFKKLGHPKKSKLLPGDVLCSNTHVAMYVGNGQIAEAGGGDDNIRNSVKWNSSIRVRNLTAANYAKLKRAYRYNASVNTVTNIKHGEVSDRVKLWQSFLNWYYDGKVGTSDGYFGDNTLKWTKKFQKDTGLTVDGIIGVKTLERAAKAEKEVNE